MSCLGFSTVLAADGSWNFQIDEQDQPALSYLDSNDKTVFLVGCGARFALRAVYPGAPKRAGERATITIANAKIHMDFAGQIDSGYNAPPNTTPFAQSDLGYSRQDPALYGKKWHELEARFFDLLDSGQPLTVSAEGRNYILPPVNVLRWRLRFGKIC